MNTNELPAHLQAVKNLQANRAEHFRQNQNERRAVTRDAEYAKLLEQQKNDIENGFWRCCLSCMYWNKEAASCDKFKAVPPPHIIVHGCRDYEDDIPF